MEQLIMEPVNYCCEGCDRIEPEEMLTCTSYQYPEKKWKLGNCPLATHVKVIIKKDGKKRRVGHQKQKRQGKKS